MRRSPLAAVITVTFLLAACGDQPSAPAPGPARASTTAVSTGTAGASAPAPAMDMQEVHKLWDTTARGLLDSLMARVFDPRRDALLEHLDGTVAVRSRDVESRYEFTYDSAHPADDPVKVEAVSEPGGTPSGTAKAARKWAIQSCAGAYPLVAFYRPPTQLRLLPASDPTSKNLIVWAPAFRGPLNVSYSFDERQVVTSRGEWTDEEHRAITSFEWEFWRGRYLLRREKIKDGADISYDYGETDGVNLLTAVHLRDGPRAVEAAFTYRSVRRRPN